MTEGPFYNLKKIGRTEGLSGRTLGDFIKFFRMRFPDKVRGAKTNDFHYAQEWAMRFMAGVEVTKADLDSLRVLKKVNPEKYTHQDAWIRMED